ncbi:MAG TPA: tripartite tricarboxylate transporter substrate binding protein [Pseudolabrys sp.]|nr:tripartite tricarboxylate transporter substrate binding protein [Pseudolabrys sp.]
MRVSKCLSVLLCFAAIALVPGIAGAQPFPTKGPIHLIVPFPAGGPSDIIARSVGQKMAEILKQKVVVDNRGGAGGVLGTEMVAKADPDGYTIAISSAGALAISASVQKGVPYDATKDFAPVTLVAKVPEMLVVATSVPASNMAELVALAKKEPGKLNFASSGIGSMPHLAGELLKLNAHINIVHVPYRGAAPAVNDLLGQQVQMVFLDLPILIPQVKAGKLKAIAIGTTRRVPVLPDVPTMVEVGYPKIQTENWYGMVAPKNTPANVVARLNKAAAEALRSDEVKKRLNPLGVIVVGDKPEEFAAFLKSEKEKWAGVVHAAGIKPQ